MTLAAVPCRMGRLAGASGDGCTRRGVREAARLKPMSTSQRSGLARSIDLRDPKGGDPSEWPPYLRVREFPNAA